jgi:ketosteroid isomerase-like protein
VSDSGEQALVRGIYGFNWAKLKDLDQSLEAFAGVIAPEFEMRLSPEVGSRVIRNLAELRNFADAIAQDFEECTYEPRELLDAPDGRVVVTGEIVGRGRSSKLPLSGEFAHVWTISAGKALRAEAYRHRSEAMEAVGLEESA